MTRSLGKVANSVVHPSVKPESRLSQDTQSLGLDNLQILPMGAAASQPLPTPALRDLLEPKLVVLVLLESKSEVLLHPRPKPAVQQNSTLLLVLEGAGVDGGSSKSWIEREKSRFCIQRSTSC